MGNLPEDKTQELKAALEDAGLDTPKTPIYYLASSGTWNADVYWGRGDDGRMKKLHRQSYDPAKLAEKVLDLEAKRAAKKPAPMGRKWKFDAWLDYWLEELAPVSANENTVERTYEPQARLYLKPRRGGFELEELVPSHFKTLYRELELEGLSAGSIGHVHATARKALNEAVAEGLIDSNPVSKVKPPEVKANSPKSFDDREVERLIEVLERRRNRTDWRSVRQAARWHVACLGSRQGEALGLRLDCYDPDTGLVDVRWQLQRRKYKHGCADPVACAAPHHRGEVCPGQVWEHGCKDPQACARPHCGRLYYPFEERERAAAAPARKIRQRCKSGCTRHARTCPDRFKGRCSKHKNCKPCPVDCAGHAIKCPQRTGGLTLMLSTPEEEGAEEATAKPSPVTGRQRGRKRDRGEEKGLEPKTEAGKRRAALPEYARLAINQWLVYREELRRRAGSKWEGDRWQAIFCDELGRPVDPRRDWDEWNEITEEAAVAYREPHVNRRNAAKAALVMGVDRRVVMAMFGWTSEAMITRYQDVPDELLLEAADRMGQHYTKGRTTMAATSGTEIDSIADLLPAYETA
jgi:site-specific recombinase XerD